MLRNDVRNDDAHRDESNVTSSSDHLTMSFAFGNTQVNLELEKNENIPQLLSYYTAENGKLIQWTVDDEEQVKLLTWVIGKAKQSKAKKLFYEGAG